MNVRNLPAYFKERFPPVNMFLFAILFFTVHAVSFYFFASNPSPVFLGWGVLAVISFFFRLRVFDEIKDYDIDVENHPGRVLQSGRVSLQNLILLSAVLFVIEASWSIYAGTDAMLCWLAAIFYSVLMRYEFFTGRFLKKYLLLYAVTHMMIMPLIILWIWASFAPAQLFHRGFYFLAALAFLGGFCFEIARKTHAASAERLTVDSYSKSLGFLPAISLVLSFLALGVLCQFYLLQALSARWWPYILIGILFIATALTYLLNVKEPKEKMLRVAELLVSLFMLFSYLTIIIEILITA